nr:MAG TPA: hypothetical protein [Caudoviricetes sp.]
MRILLFRAFLLITQFYKFLHHTIYAYFIVLFWFIDYKGLPAFQGISIYDFHHI